MAGLYLGESLSSGKRRDEPSIMTYYLTRNIIENMFLRIDIWTSSYLQATSDLEGYSDPDWRIWP
jgi:hypothetical protein